MIEIEGAAHETRTQLRDYAAVLRLRKWSIVSVTALATGGALFLSIRETPMYESTARVLVTPVALSPGDPATVVPVNLETERGLAASVPVAERVIDELHLAEPPEVLLEDLEVEVVANSEFLVVTVLHHDPLASRRRAQAFANSYLDFRRDQAINDVLAAAGSVQDRIEQVQTQLQAVGAELRRATPSRRVELESRSNLLLSQLAVLQQKLGDLTPGHFSVGQVVEPATVPPEPATPNYPLNLARAAVVGLALGLALAFLRDRLSDRLRGRSELEILAAAPVLGVVPKIPSWRRKQARTVTIVEPKSAASEAYRTLRTALTFAAMRDGIKVLLVASAQPGEGKTATVANLAVALAGAGKRVVAVSADLRKPRLHQFLGGRGDGPGLTTVLRREATVKAALQPTSAGSLQLLSTGPVLGNPNDALGSERMVEVIRELRRISDLVLIDSAPILAVADPLALAPLSDAVLLVADAGKTMRASVAQARRELDHVNARVIGAVLNKFIPSKAKGYDYYYVNGSDEWKGRSGRRRLRRSTAEQSPGMWSG